MIRAVLDTNVLISALLSPEGAPAQILRTWLAGVFELILSRHLIEELDRALAYRKIRARVEAEEAQAFRTLLERVAVIQQDEETDAKTTGPGDVDLIALTQRYADVLVTGDRALLAEPLPIPALSPRDFLDALEGGTN